MVLTLNSVVSARAALDRIAKLETLNARESYGIARLIRTLDPDYTYAVREHMRLVEKHRDGEVDESGKVLITDPASYNREIEDILSIETGELDIMPVKIRGDAIGIRADDMVRLDGMIIIED